MTKRLLIFVSTLSFLIASSAFAAGTEPVRVLIDSRPDHAEIRLAGKFVGTTPLEYRLVPGEHRIELSRARYKSWVRELTVTTDIPTKVTALLDPTEKEPCK